MRNKKRTTSSRPQTEEPIGSIVFPHILLEKQGKKSACCYLSSMMVDDSKERASIYGCFEQACFPCKLVSILLFQACIGRVQENFFTAVYSRK